VSFTVRLVNTIAMRNLAVLAGQACAGHHASEKVLGLGDTSTAQAAVSINTSVPVAP